MRIRGLWYGPLLFAAVNRFSLEIDKPARLWSWADNKDTDQHEHLRTVIWTFVVCRRVDGLWVSYPLKR